MDIIFVFSTSNYTPCSKKKQHLKSIGTQTEKIPFPFYQHSCLSIRLYNFRFSAQISKTNLKKKNCFIFIIRFSTDIWKHCNLYNNHASFEFEKHSVFGQK